MSETNLKIVKDPLIEEEKKKDLKAYMKLWFGYQRETIRINQEKAKLDAVLLDKKSELDIAANLYKEKYEFGPDDQINPRTGNKAVIKDGVVQDAVE